MSIKEINISRKLTQQLLHLAQLSPNQEVCGLIGSKNGIPLSCYPIDNIADTPHVRFLLDPQQQIAAISQMRVRNEELFAIYHSHPTTPALPSATDIKMAHYPEAVHLIISLNTKGVLEMRGFIIKDQNVQEVSLSMIS